jgi:hypothetical protein
MSDGPSASDGGSLSDDDDQSTGVTAATSGEIDSPPELRLRIAEYDGRPDRATIYPDEVPSVDALETWISVDVSVVELLEAWR